jgi:hypothetical protein
MKCTRRNFVKTAGAGVLAAGLPASLISSTLTAPVDVSEAFRLAVADIPLQNSISTNRLK